MNEIVSESHRQALDKMADARKILFRELHYPELRTLELVEGVERLSLAFEYVENPLDEVLLCPNCECFCLELLPNGNIRCLSCDHSWPHEETPHA